MCIYFLSDQLVEMTSTLFDQRLVSIIRVNDVPTAATRHKNMSIYECRMTNNSPDSCLMKVMKQTKLPEMFKGC